MIDADRPRDRDGLGYPERDVMVATLLGITPERVRTIRRVQRKRMDGAKPARRGGLTARWQRVDQLDDDALFAALRRSEMRARAVERASIASPVDRGPRRAIGRR